MDAITVIVIWAAIIGLYFLPTIIASHNHKKNQNSILALNLFLGWTVLGWIGALVWAVSKD
jgi:Superinfection immunity protein